MKELEPAEFVYTISNIEDPEEVLRFTKDWLETRNVSTKKIDKLVGEEPRTIIIGCITAVMRAQKAIAAKAGMAKLTPEERSARAKKAVKARIEKHGK